MANFSGKERYTNCDGNIMVLGCFAASGTGQLALIDSTMNSAYQWMLEDNGRPSVQKLKLNQKWTFQQDNDPSMLATPPKNGPNRRSGELWNGQVKAQIWNVVRGGGLKRAEHTRKTLKHVATKRILHGRVFKKFC